MDETNSVVSAASGHSDKAGSSFIRLSTDELQAAFGAEAMLVHAARRARQPGCRTQSPQTAMHRNDKTLGGWMGRALPWFLT